ncbi:MAG: gamma-glutamyl-phosphate reductase, partial [Pseudomonadota bacterium]
MSSVEAVPLGAQSAGAEDLAATMASLGEDARRASRTLSRATTQQKTAALRAMAQAIRDRAPDILRANRLDLEAAAASGLGPALTDRLRLDEKRLAGIALGVDDIAALEDPVGTTIRAWERPNGLHIARVRVPLGVIGIIYESRPNVTADAGALCLKSGNAVILRGGKESFHSSTAIHAALVDGLLAADLPAAAISLVPVKDRAA